MAASHPSHRRTVDSEDASGVQAPAVSASRDRSPLKRKGADPDYAPPPKKARTDGGDHGQKVPDPASKIGPFSGNPKGTTWSPREVEATIEIIKDLKAANYYGDNRWERASQRLWEEYRIERTPNAVKNQWNRVIRAQSGLDERKRPNPQMMVTGALAPGRTRRREEEEGE